MANEIQLSASLSAQKNGSSVSGSANGVNMTMAGNLTNKIVQLISSSSWTALQLGGAATTPTAMLFKNLDAANFITLATDNAGAHTFAKVTKGVAIPLVPPAAITYWAKADTADCYAEIDIAE